jgi:hypothetical protein
MKLNDTGTNDFNYNLGDIRFQYNYNANSSDNTDMSIRAYDNGGSTNVKLIRIKLGSQLMMGPDGIPGGGRTPSMGYLEWKDDRFRLVNHDGDIRLDTTAGNGGLIRLKTVSGNVIRLEAWGGGYVEAKCPVKLYPTTTSSVTNDKAGMMIYNTATDRPAFYNGTEWIDL